MKTVTCTFNPMTHKVVPIEMTEDMKMASDINSAYSAEEQYKFIIDVAPEYPADSGKPKYPEPAMPFIGMILCETCGNKRCPHATDKKFTCTGSARSSRVGKAHS